MTARAPRYVVVLEPIAGDGRRALRWLLKSALRRHRLRALDIRQLPAAAGAGGRRQHRSAAEVRPMDMSKYAGSSFIGVDDVKDHPLRAVIAWIEIGKFNKPVLVFDNGLKFTLNTTNTTTMLRELGAESDDWIGEKIELALGQAKFQDKLVDSVVLEVVARADGVEKPEVKVPKSAGKPGDMDEEIPF
jgi:hypothetical protein